MKFKPRIPTAINKHFESQLEHNNKLSIKTIKLCYDTFNLIRRIFFNSILNVLPSLYPLFTSQVVNNLEVSHQAYAIPVTIFN